MEGLLRDIARQTHLQGVQRPRRKGFGHIAFRVDDVDETLSKIVEHGGSHLGEPVTIDVPGAGRIRWVTRKATS